MTPTSLWQRYLEGLRSAAGVTLDLSRVSLPRSYFTEEKSAISRAYGIMDAIERGEKANIDEKRQVGHYWLRAPERAPSPQIRKAIEDTIAALKGFALDVHSGRIRPEEAERFRSLLLVGIGGSALGPQLVADALGSPSDRMRLSYIDNTDPEGIDRTIGALGPQLRETLTVVTSKSGGTAETRNGMIEVAHAYAREGLSFAPHAVAITMEGSSLDRQASSEGWLRRFPMWDWVGGRTSELSAVGLLPAYLQGIDGDAMLAGAREMDEATRDKDPTRNLALLLALAWHRATNGRGEKDMVILPYKDRLLLLSRYLQQLIMESLGKELDLDGKVVHQGITVYGNKGSTDQHSYVQQLRDGVANFFVTFIEVLQDRAGASVEVEPGETSGDYLLGFLLGTRQALFEKGRESITITLEELSPRTVGAVIALYERAVGFYAGLVNVNAYHQPGVQAGKLAAAKVLEAQHRALSVLERASGPLTAEQVAEEIRKGEEEERRSAKKKDSQEALIDEGWRIETVYKVLEHLAANRRGVVKVPGGKGPADTRYRKERVS